MLNIRQSRVIFVQSRDIALSHKIFNNNKLYFYNDHGEQLTFLIINAIYRRRTVP